MRQFILVVFTLLVLSSYGHEKNIEEKTKSMTPVETLLSYFENGAFPNETQFRELIQSLWHKSERVPIEQIEHLVDELSLLLERTTFNDTVQNLVTDISYKLEKGTYEGTADDLHREIQSILDGAGKTYLTITEAMAVFPLPSDNTPFRIKNNPVSADDGDYIYLSSEPDGYKFFSNSVAQTIDQNNTTEPVAGKAVFDEVLPLKSFATFEKHSLSSYGTATSGGNTTTIEPYGIGVNTFGLKQTTVVASNGYSYMVARVSNNLLYSDLATQKLKFVIRAETPCEFRFRLTNGTAWGSANNTVGSSYSQILSFNEANNFTQEVEIDLSDTVFSDFYSEAQRQTDNLQRLFFIITANEGANTPHGTHVLSSYVFDLNQDVINKLSIPYLNQQATLEDIENVKNYVDEQLEENLPEQSFDNIPVENLELRGGSPFSLVEVSKTIFELKKVNGLPSTPVMGIYIEFPYSELSELNRDFVINATKNAGSNLNQLKILKTIADWNPINFPVHLSFQNGENVINLYEAIMNSSQSVIDYYTSANTLQLYLGYFNGFDASVSTDLILDYDLQMYLKKERFLNIASDLTEALKNELIQVITGLSDQYITCWGDSLTALGGWTTRLETLSGMHVYNGGTGGENAKTIPARQGGDVMIVNNITIPASNSTSVVIADRDIDSGISTQNGNIATPLLQGGAHVNPCFIGDIEGTLQWTGSSHSDMTGNWIFTRAVSGAEVEINRPTAIRTDFDINRNEPHLQVIFIGQNGGYSDNADLIRQHRLMIEHSRAKHTIVLGLSSGSESSRADYEAAMKSEFGRYFISLREYLATPIYNTDGEIVSCYGLDDAELIATQADLNDIAIGKVPSQLFIDGIHYTEITKTVIGNMVFKKCKDLNIF